MIRRGFWFATGAVAGIAGYRRASRAVRTLLPQADLLTPAGRIAGRAARRALGPGAGLHEVTGPGTGTSQAGRAGQRAAAGTAAFVRDIRIGMADYLDARRDI